MTREEALELIGTERNGKRVIGVDNRPPKQRDGVWLVLAEDHQPVEYERVS